MNKNFASEEKTEFINLKNKQEVSLQKIIK